jgi:glutathione S-transferase
LNERLARQREKIMESLTLYGFQRSTYVNVARLVLNAKGVSFAFHDTEKEMYTEEHRKRHPFGRVPVLQHGDFWLYETSAIAHYIDEAFDGPRLQPADVMQRARMRQWIGNLDSYFYPYIVYHLVHERVVFAELGIDQDERVVADALPKCARALEVMEAELERGGPYLIGEAATLADFFLLPTLTALGFTREGRGLLQETVQVREWLLRMGKIPSVVQFRSTLPAFVPIEHARRWVHDHRPKSSGTPIHV